MLRPNAGMGKGMAKGAAADKWKSDQNADAAAWMMTGGKGKGFSGDKVVQEVGAGTPSHGYAVGGMSAKPNKGGGRGVGTRKMAKADGQGAFINGKLAPQSHSLTKAASSGMMSKKVPISARRKDQNPVQSQLKQEAGNWMRQGASGKGFPSGTGAVISEHGAGTKDFGYSMGTSSAKTGTGGGKGVGTRKMAKANTRSKVQPGSEGQERQDWNAFVRVGGAKNKDTTWGKPVAKGARMCKCGSGMSKSMCKCGM